MNEYGISYPTTVKREKPKRRRIRKPVKCDGCGKWFNRYDARKKHYESACEGNPNKVRTTFPCSLCGRTFEYKRNLVRHFKTHVANATS